LGSKKLIDLFSWMVSWFWSSQSFSKETRLCNYGSTLP